MNFTEAKNNRLVTRRHYLTVAQENIDRQITELREKRHDLAVEIIRINQKLNVLPEIPVLRPVEKQCVKLEVRT